MTGYVETAQPVGSSQVARDPAIEVSPATIRSDIPVYAFTSHEATRRRVTLYRGVYPVIFDVAGAGDSAESLYRALFTRLLELKLVDRRDLVILTKGEASGVQGGTNSMQILKVALD